MLLYFHEKEENKRKVTENPLVCNKFPGFTSSKIHSFNSVKDFIAL